jgi:predicted phage-related endonuclease
MRRSVKQDLFDACDALDHLIEILPKMNMAEQVDVVARLRGASKTIEKLDVAVKRDIKDHLKGKEGTVPGEIFKAVLQLVVTTRLDQQKLKADYPEVFTKCQKTSKEGRITFEPRGN